MTDPNRMAGYIKIEALFEELLAAASSVLSESELGKIRHFIDHGEYGLAAETAVDQFIDNNKAAPNTVVSLIEQLGNEMNMDLPSLMRSLFRGSHRNT